MAGFGSPKKDVVFALAVASGTSVSDAAKQAGLSERSAYRRMADPEFRARVGALRERFMTTALGELSDSMTAAAQVLRGLLGEKEPGTRLRAARAVLSLGMRLHETIDVGERIRAIESTLAQAQGGAA